MPCPKKVELLKSYHSATEAYMDSVTVLWAKIGTLNRADYDRIRLATERLRTKSEAARLGLELHMDTHNC
jgi:hypothetical protein